MGRLGWVKFNWWPLTSCTLVFISFSMSGFLKSSWTPAPTYPYFILSHGSHKLFHSFSFFFLLQLVFSNRLSSNSLILLFDLSFYWCLLSHFKFYWIYFSAQELLLHFFNIVSILCYIFLLEHGNISPCFLQAHWDFLKHLF